MEKQNAVRMRLDKLLAMLGEGTRSGIRDMVRAAKREFDYIFLDAPAGIDAGFELAAKFADRCLIVTGADPAAMRDAARAAQAHDFISGFAQGYDTFIAEKGASLSGGQKQRMSITRALVRRPEIMILDDATSALDLSTEARLRTAMRERLRGSTVIMVAQRIASVKHADRIAGIEADGSILHCAPHEELLRISPTYLDIVRSQENQGGAVR